MSHRKQTGKRAHRSRIAKETVEISDNGVYHDLEGSPVDISADISHAVEKTEEFSPSDLTKILANVSKSPQSETKVHLTNETTFAAARRIVTANSESDTPIRIAALNFASAKNPGGGFLGGSQAQEEALSRASALYKCINGKAMYDINRANPHNGLYSHHMLYTPLCPVFRDDDDNLCDPYKVDIITAPAVNAGHAMTKNEPLPTIQKEMQERMRRVLALAAEKKVDIIILGAFGCGVFKNDPKIIGEGFSNLVYRDFSGVFKEVVFAIPDERGANYRAFASQLTDAAVTSY